MKFDKKLFLLLSLGMAACSSDEDQPETDVYSPYITKVLDYRPAVGQHVNVFPKYEDGDTQEIMNNKALKAFQNKEFISLGGFGGYVIVGFDHTIQNVAGKKDFRVLGNAFLSNVNPGPNSPTGGSSEPGVIMVAQDKNKNGIPDPDEWYEIAGSAHVDATKEPWYAKAVAAGNNVETCFGYEITYYRPEQEPQSDEEKQHYIKWEDNQGENGFKVMNEFHSQSYYPKWIKDSKLTFKGTRLPQNGINEGGSNEIYVLYAFGYGYADNAVNSSDDACIDIDWAVDASGKKADLSGVDFIKIYTGVNQENGNIGENSTEVAGIEDLHLLK